MRILRRRNAGPKADPEEEAIYKDMIAGNYDLAMTRTFTSEEKEKVDRAVKRAIRKNWDTLSYHNPHQLRANLKNRGIMEYDPELVKDTIIEMISDGLCKVEKPIEIYDLKLREFASAFEIRTNDPRIESAALDLIKKSLLSTDMSVIKLLLEHVDVSKDKIGEVILEYEPELSKRKGLYDPVKIAEQLGVSKSVIEEIALRYHNKLLGEGNSIGAAITGRDAKVPEDQTTLDAYQRLLDSGDYKGARRLIIESSILTPADRIELIEAAINLERRE
ncbi:MAG: hypothetical protein KGH64_02855 [Candidatus Micrarchaeota archaeon]|nr:hypothetical protein [Candidatus Micrarchaeota archaeon]MDE1834252.1 hypothetical protein [Candidatus Micrarchaeota archaeon]MDE1858920.1 hypothetical protein [Candidatus Micrarchaeota archaeon]